MPQAYEVTVVPLSPLEALWGSGAMVESTPEGAVRCRLRDLADLMNEELDKPAIRKAIDGLAKSMMLLPQCEAHLGHIFCDGLYGRKWSCAKGNFIVTEIWKVQNISSLIKGKIVIATENGFETMEAGSFFVTEPGTQRVIFILEDATFTTVHPNPTNERDTDKLLESLTTVTKYDKVPGSIGLIEELL